MSKTPEANFLDAIEIKTPCSESWSEMRGTQQIRFCSHCAKDVHNLSAMTRKKARRLVAASNGGICVRYIRQPDGKIQTIRKALHQITRQTGIAAGVLGASLTISTLSYAQATENPVAETQFAQTVNQNSDSPNATVSGTIFDPNGAVIPFAFITLTCEQANFYQTATANQEGFYEFKDVPRGEYKLKIDASGFASQEIAQFNVGGNSEITQNSRLAVQKVSEAVQIGGDEKTEDSSVMGTTYATVGLISLSPHKINPLITAAENNDLDEVKLRVGMGARVNSKDKGYDGNSPLHVAAENGNLEIAGFLLDHGSKINSRNNEKQTPLMLLDEDANAEFVNLLIRHGAKVNLFDKQGNTALMSASENASLEVVQTLISAGANVNAVSKNGSTALMKAAENGETEIVQLLLGSGANANARNREGDSALSLTSSETAKQYLVAFGAVK